jgi:hypothetical protein
MKKKATTRKRKATQIKDLSVTRRKGKSVKGGLILPYVEQDNLYKKFRLPQ